MAEASVRPRRILVVGCGSIGRRHTGNLLVLGQRELRLVDPDSQALKRACAAHGLAGSPYIEEGLAWKPEVVLVANPTAYHVATALEAARHGCHLFVEKPLGNSLQGMEELLQTVQERRLVTMVGCNLRFHPGPKLVHESLAQGTIGRPLAARLEAGSYLPSWRPGTRYQESYSASKMLGGGCILDGIHELDLACWYFGWPREVFARAAEGASLGIETEALAEILLTYPDGLLVSIHLDYVQRWRQRRCEVIGERGTIAWEARREEVQRYREDASAPERLGYEPGYDINQMYVEELREFLRCVDERESCAADVHWAARVTQIALAAKQSVASRQPVSVDVEPLTAGVG
jgi:predicted dehydrogenase